MMIAVIWIFFAIQNIDIYQTKGRQLQHLLFIEDMFLYEIRDSLKSFFVSFFVQFLLPAELFFLFLDGYAVCWENVSGSGQHP